MSSVTEKYDVTSLREPLPSPFEPRPDFGQQLSPCQCPNWPHAVHWVFCFSIVMRCCLSARCFSVKEMVPAALNGISDVDEEGGAVDDDGEDLLLPLPLPFAEENFRFA